MVTSEGDASAGTFCRLVHTSDQHLARTENRLKKTAECLVDPKVPRLPICYLDSRGSGFQLSESSLGTSLTRSSQYLISANSREISAFRV